MGNLFSENRSFSVKLIFVLVLVALFAVWRFYFVSVVSGLPGNFYNETKVFTVKKNYDNVTGEYNGAEELDSAVVYKASDLNGDKLTIDGSFVSKDKDGREIFHADRQYEINRRTYELLSFEGEGVEGGVYLFTPRRDSEDSFAYRSLIYDMPIEMKYQEETEILGLQVYHYNASFTADVTKNLTKFSGVTEGKGLVADVVLDLWVDPNTGIMIDYNDTANFYSYILETGERASPWGTWSTDYTLDSIGNHVDLSTQQKSRIFLMSVIVPIVSSVVIAGLIIWCVVDLMKILKRRKESENVIEE